MTGACHSETGTCVYSAAQPAFSTTGECRACAEPNVVSADRTQCYACLPGSGPADGNRTVC
eukprot:SAG11_NODE_29494_length_310_cov_0.924171_1_plen_60_part_10